MAELLLSAVQKVYPNGVAAVHGVDCAVADAELIVVVGPSGCGKSTLLRMIAGLERITAGEIRIGGRVVNDLEPAERDIAMVFQNYALYPHMTVFANMAYGLKIRGMAKAEIAERVARTARILELGELLERKPRQLSGGQRQRVAMGRAIVREPAVFLFDEPLSNLDAKLRVQMRIEIKRLQERLGTTSVYVTHDQVEAMTLGHRLLVMNQGHVEQLGTPIELYERPATLFVAGFIGSPAMNILPARITEDGTRAALLGGVSLPLAGDGLAAQAGREVALGIRPEHLELAPEGASDPQLLVDLVEKLGADTLVHGRLGADDHDFTLRLKGLHDLHSGATLPLRMSPGQFHLFDRDTGRRIG